MDRKTRYYKVDLGVDQFNPDKDESLYIKVNEDRTINIVKEATNRNPKIILRSLLKELTAREYVEEVNNLTNQRTSTIQSLETRVDNMKE